MRILVAVADPALQAAVADALAMQGHELIQAQDGFQALSLFRTRAPDLLLATLKLANLDGLELARLVRLSAHKRFVPILMFADDSLPEFFRKCLEAGVVEFISNPFQPGELRCRVETVARLVRIQNTLLENQAHSQEEQTAVKHLLNRLAGGEQGPTPGFHMETVQTRRINGDACAHRVSLPGVHFGLICDATGHGLMAGICTIPVLDTFLGMVMRDIPLGTIYQEIHRKLLRLLPTGRFACLLLLRLDVARGILSVLNAGMPEVLLLRADLTIQRFTSKVLPAGISGADPGIVVSEAGVEAGDRIFACSDGLADIVLPEALQDHYLLAPSKLSHSGHCTAIQRLVNEVSRGADHQDDLSWALWEVPGAAVPLPQTTARPTPPAQLVPGLETTFRLDPRLHAPRELLPHVLSLLLDFQVSHAQTQLFGMLLMEALTNAVEHGLLRLDSQLKHQGFEAYEQHRQEALTHLGEGSVRFTVSLFHDAGAPGGPVRRLRADVEDTGAGFNWRAWTQAQADHDEAPYGRGIALLLSLGQELTFNGPGNRLSFSLECP